MLLSPVCRPWQPDRAAKPAQDSRSYTTPWGTIWLKTASERLHRNKLAVALANKLARIAWSVLRHDKAFDTHLETVAI